jgi:hypothetical protein
VDGSHFSVKVTGTADSVVEIGQQLAWLGAALRSSPLASGIAICSPSVRKITQIEKDDPDQLFLVTLQTALLYEIGFDLDLTSEIENQTQGHCWHAMFRHPMLVKGYPIMTKAEKGLGIEMSLGIMARLINSKRINELDSKLVIESFSSMLVAMKVAGDLVVWHHLFNSKGEWISGAENTIDITEEIDIFRVGSLRHVVGWCSDCSYVAGRYDTSLLPNTNIK